MVAVLGSAGRTEKFKDCMRLVEWVHYKLSIVPEDIKILKINPIKEPLSTL